MLTRLWDNQSANTRLRQAFYRHPRSPALCLLASPFFTAPEVIKYLLSRGHEVRMIVRLGEITSPSALAEILPNERCLIRFYISERFHSKVYIFGNELALVGSGNLTDGGLNGNAEAALSIPGDNPVFDDVVRLFQSYWDTARPLDRQTLLSFRIAVDSEPRHTSTLSKRLRDALGDVEPPNTLDLTKRPKTTEHVYGGQFRKDRQIFDSAFSHLRARYVRKRIRKVPEDILPLRLEIDQFLSWLREKHAVGESYLEQPELDGHDIELHVDRYLDEWMDAKYAHLDDGTAAESYQKLNNAFGSSDAIRSLEAEEIAEALCELNSVRERRRYFAGSLAGLRRAFLEANDRDHIRDTITFILHGSGDPADRMGRAIYQPEFSLKHFGRSNVQELFGMVNSIDAPVRNGRTVKAMRFLGYRVDVFD